MTDPADFALAYARRNLAVFPLWTAVPSIAGGAFICKCGSARCGSPAKHPMSRLVPHGLKDATTDADMVRHLWACAPDANVGIALGHGHVVLDIDPRHGGDKALAELEQRHGALPPTWRARTGSGGLHIHFGTTVEIRNSAGAVAPGIDIKTIGGYVGAPPSLHISGNRYAWDLDHHPNKVQPAELPAWLIEAARTRISAVAPGTAWRDLVRDGVDEGQRNNVIAKLTGHLLRRRVDALVVLDFMLVWNRERCRPPLDDDAVATVVNSIAGRELRRRGCTP